MAVNEKNILNRFYFVAGGLFVFALLITIQLVRIQFVNGKEYRALAKEKTVKNFEILANRGNIYADDGSLLATSVPKYEIRFDAVTVTDENFEKYIGPLSVELGKMFDKSAGYFEQKLRKAKETKNRFMLLAKNLGYSDYVKIKSFPLFKLGANSGGIITEQTTVREHPIGEMGLRTIGYEHKNDEGHFWGVGLERAYGDLLRGKEGRRMKQKIAKGQWKPLSDDNEIEPKDGYDIITTINVNIQDVAHHALLKQLELYEATYGSVVVMEVKTGAIKAISNLSRKANGTYEEDYNHAIGKATEPGSTFKVMSFIAALEDKKIDTSTVVNTGNGSHVFYDRRISDSKRGGYGKISAARALEVSSNIGLGILIDDAYSKNPSRFISILESWNLDQKLGLDIKGEAAPKMPKPDKKEWSDTSLPAMAYGYGLTMTPLQTLTFYNAIANDGVMVKPRFIKEVRTLNKEVEAFKAQVINPRICSIETINQVKAVMENVVKRGTAQSLYSENFSMAGKTGTARAEYWHKDWKENPRYVSSFAGFFPADSPKYSCIVIIHQPSVKKGYYGADVSGPVFKAVAQKIYIDAPYIDTVKELEKTAPSIDSDYDSYYAQVQATHKNVPKVTGMAGMDAVSLLENIGLNVIIVGNGKVVKQSLTDGTPFRKGQQIVLTLS
jgi:cell division protein FtsI (penicillin-binding protein 3)